MEGTLAANEDGLALRLHIRRSQHRLKICNRSIDLLQFHFALLHLQHKPLKSAHTVGYKHTALSQKFQKIKRALPKARRRLQKIIAKNVMRDRRLVSEMPRVHCSTFIPHVDYIGKGL